MDSSQALWLLRTVELLPDVIYRLDCQGRIVFVNQAIAAYGNRPAELIGRPLAGLIHPEDWARTERQLNERRQGERRTRSLEVRLLARTGDPVYVEVRSREVTTHALLAVDAEGVYDQRSDGTCEWVGTVGVARDITERKEHEREQQALARIQDAVSAMRTPDDAGAMAMAVFRQLEEVGIPLYTFGINLILRTATGYRMSSYARYAQEDRVFYTAEYHEDVARIITAMWRTGKTQYRRDLAKEDPWGEWPLVSADKPARRCILDVPFSHGTLALSHPEPEVITDRQVAFCEQVAHILTTSFTRLDDIARLADQRGQYRALFEAAGETLLAMEGDRIVDCNPSAVALFARPREQLVGASVLDLSPPLQPDGRASAAAAAARVEAALAGPVQHFIWRHLRPSGAPFDCEVTLSRGGGQGERAVLAVVRDITERKEHEREQQALARIQDAVSTMRSPDDAPSMVRSIFGEFRALGIPFYLFGINLLVPSASGRLIRSYFQNEPDGPIHMSEQPATLARVILGIWNTGRTQYRHNLEQDDPWEEWPLIRHEVPCRHSIIDIPFSHGTLALSHPEPEAFTDRQVAFLEQVAHVLTTSFTRLDDIARLADQRGQYRALFEAAGDAIFVLDEGRIVDCNPRAQALFGYGRDEMIGAVPSDFAPQTQRDGRSSAELVCERLRAVCGGKVLTFDYLHRRRDGTVLNTEVTLSPVTFGGRPCVQAAVRDISHQTWLRSLYQTDLAGLFRADRTTGRLIDCNQRFAELGGYGSVAECLATYRIERHQPDLAQLERQREVFAGTAEAWSWEGRFRRLDGTFFWAQINCRLSPYEPYVEGLVLDVTDRIQAQQALVQSSRLMALGEMAAGMAHELRNPLQVISVCAEGQLLRGEEAETPLPPQYREDAELVLSQVDRISSLIEHLRIFSKERPLGDLGPVDLREAVTNAIRLVGQQLAHHTIELSQSLPEEPLLVLGDLYRLEQVLLNLLNNARQALESVAASLPRRIEVHCRTENRSAVIEVSDNGPGIPAEHHQRLFTPFFTTKGDGGTGLGLSICHAIVRQHQGSLTYLTRPGGGALFRITLPLSAGNPLPV